MTESEGSRLEVWLRAARPRTLSAAAAPVLVGTGLAVEAGAFALLPALACLACAELIQVGTNLYNDYSDYALGADTEDRTGETRMTQAGLLPPGRVRAAALATFGAALLLGTYLARLGGWPIVAIGSSAILAGIGYTGGPWPYGYRGLGDLAVFVFFGLIGVAGTFYVQAGRWSAESLWAGAGVGAFTTAVLVVNNLRDIPTDRRAGKRTLAVILGARAARTEFAALLGLAGLVPPVGWFAFGWPASSLLSLAAFVPATPPARTVLAGAGRRPEERSKLDPALTGTARALGAYGLLLAAGLSL